MSELKSMVAELVERINASPEMLAVIRDWVDGYNGKTIGFKTPEGTFYVTFSERARINEVFSTTPRRCASTSNRARW
ncbi:MAG: hypothetical protein ACTSRV_16620 [Candidatus Freyarchaeota archaeon]